MDTTTGRPLRVLRSRDVVDRTGIPVSTRYELLARGEFPAPIRLDGRTDGRGLVGWVEHEIDAWIASRIRASRGEAA